MTKVGRGDGVIFAILAVAMCCAVPALLAVGGGALAAAAGLVARYWPLTVLGGAVVVIGALRIASLVRTRNRKEPPV
jgi:hypothetical protein